MYDAEEADIIKLVMAVHSCLLNEITLLIRTNIHVAFKLVTGQEIKVMNSAPPITAQMESATVTLSW